MALQRIDGHSPNAFSSIGGFLGEAAEAAAGFICGIDRAYPGFTRFGVTGIQSTLMGAMLDAMCGAPGRGGAASPPQQPPFLGGQCDARRYRLSMKGVLDRDPNNVQRTDGYGCYGAIGNVTDSSTATNSGTVQINCRGTFVWNVQSPSLRPQGVYGTGIIVQPGIDHRTWSIESVSPLGGFTDNCGNPPPAHPIVPLPPGATKRDINLPSIGVAIPFVYIPIKPEFSLSPTFSPQFQIDVGGLNFNFDLGGVTVNLPDINPSPAPLPYPGLPSGGNPPNATPIPPRTPGGNGSGTANCPPCPPCPELPELEVRRKYLEVTLTSLPDKVQFGDEGQESVFFAGWVAFLAPDGGYTPRQQINFRKSVFEFPHPDWSEYTITFTNGAKGQTRTYLVEEE